MLKPDLDTVVLTIENNIATIALDRPKVMNAMNTQMRAEITAAVKYAQTQARVIVLTGNGKAFCSGQDLGSGLVEVERVLRDEYDPMIHAITECPLPVIAAVNGPAAGAGANLALVADVVIAAHSAYFLEAFTKIGLIPDAGGSWVLPRSVGLAKAMGAALFAEKISATEAVEMGLIWEAAPDEEFEQLVQSRAKFLATGPTEAFSRIKRSIRASFDNNMEEQLAIEAKLQGECGRTRDFKEGVAAFMEKRPPSFEGR